MLALYFLSLKMIVKIRIFSLKDSHHLIDLDLQSIKLACIHIGEMIVHQMFEYEVHIICFVGHLEDIFAQIVHSLKIADILVIKSIHPKCLH